jgi:hypothetical protein
MSRLAACCHRSFAGLRSLLPMLSALVAIRPESTCIATSIPGLGVCKSTYCHAERRARAG